TRAQTPVVTVSSDAVVDFEHVGADRKLSAVGQTFEKAGARIEGTILDQAQFGAPGQRHGVRISQREGGDATSELQRAVDDESVTRSGGRGKLYEDRVVGLELQAERREGADGAVARRKRSTRRAVADRHGPAK